MGAKLLALALLLLVPAASAQALKGDAVSTPTTLFVHVIDTQNDAPVNTQEPVDDYTFRGRTGLLTNSLCFENDAQPVLDKEYHTVFAYASPSMVEYGFMEGGRPRLHPERGVAYDVALDPRVVPVFHWYVATGAGMRDTAAVLDEAPVVVPGVTLRVTMREGDWISTGDVEYRKGRVIMEGESAPALLAGERSEGAEHSVVDGVHVYHLQTEMRLADPPLIPLATGYNIDIEVFAQNPYCTGEGSYITPNVLDLYSGPGLRPRLELAVTEPLRLDPLDAAVVGDDVMVSLTATTPWGTYDLTNLTVTLEQGDRRWSALKAPASPYHCHCYGAYMEPETWVFEDIAHELGGGPATVSVHAKTIQGYEGDTSTEVFAAPGLESPGLTAPWVLLALTSLGFALSRRR